jgi:hypothetical protein
MKLRILAGLLAAALALPACSRRPVATDTSQAADIPKEIAVQKLKELLTTVEYVYTLEPKDSLKPSEIRSMAVSTEGIDVVRQKGGSIPLAFKDVRLVQAASAGSSKGVCRVFTVKVPGEKPQFEFLFRNIPAAQQMTELVTALRKTE